MRPGKAPLTGAIEKKIAWAEAAFGAWETRIAAMPAFATMLSRLQEAILACGREMEAAGIAAVCRRCDREGGGSCCGEGIENRYDPWLLLINLLMGVDLPHRRRSPGGCFFGGDQGCRLQARHTLCVNYLCEEVSVRVRADDLLRLREREGVELDILFSLHEEIKRVLGPLCCG